MAINARIDGTPTGAPVYTPPAPMVIMPRVIVSQPPIAVGGGPYDEAYQFMRAGNDYFRSRGVPIPNESEYLWSYQQVMDYWFLRIRGYSSEYAAAVATGRPPPVGVKMRPAWYADP